MTRKSYRPGPPAGVALRPDGERWTLVFVRELRHPPARVWNALTDPAQLAQWAPFDADRDLGRTGDAVLSMAGGPEPAPQAASVRHAEAPTLLEYTWGEDVLRWELEAIATGTRLTLRHTLTDRSGAPRVAAGWHICLDVADHLLSGTPVGRIVADEALEYDWARLEQDYAARLG